MSEKPGTMKVVCPGCEARLRIPVKYSLKKYECTTCNTKFYAPELFGQYQLLDTISNDDCTSTHHAVHLETGNKCVLRRLNADYRHDGAIRRIFLQETEKLESLTMDSVVKAAAAGDVDGIPFIEFDHYGETCLKRKLKEGRLPIEEACFLFLDIVGAFESCAEQSLVHGNLKPSNIRYDEHDNIRILDFGMSAALTKELMNQKHDIRYFNNPYYIAPETVDKGELTPASDIYCIGAMFYEVIAGKKPFEKLGAVEAMKEKATKKPEPPNHLRPGVPPVLNDLIMSMMEPDPVMRPQFTVQIIAVLQKICEDDPNAQKKSASTSLDKIEIDDGYVEAAPVPEELLLPIEKNPEEEKTETVISKNAPQIAVIGVLVIIIAILSVLYLGGN